MEDQSKPGKGLASKESRKNVIKNNLSGEDFLKDWKDGITKEIYQKIENTRAKDTKEVLKQRRRWKKSEEKEQRSRKKQKLSYSNGSHLKKAKALNIEPKKDKKQQKNR